MYGMIHVCIKCLVSETFGEEKWKEILEKAGVDEMKDFMVFHKYDDSVALSLVGAASAVLGAPVETVLELFGEYFFKYCLEHGYDKMLRTLGDSLETFIQNLDSLHSLLAMSHKNIDAPSFRCITESPGKLKLHYYSVRSGLQSIVIGLLRAVGKELFNTTVDITVVNVDHVGLPSGKQLQHVIFDVKMTDADQDMLIVPSVTVSQGLYDEDEVAEEWPSLISPKIFCNLFPYHILFDDKMRIKQCGVTIQKMSHYKVNLGADMRTVFSLLHPIMEMTYENILQFINAVYIIELSEALSPRGSTTDLRALRSTKKLVIKGQMIFMEEIKQIIFIGSPRLTSLNELMDCNVYLSDIPLYDVTRELVLLNQQRIAEIEVSKKLDETTAELKRTATALEKEKEKTDFLLYQMLPKKVANQLRDGYKVDAEKFSEVTILFSDIVTFTNISAAVQPIQVVGMLNDLYTMFDELTNVNNVYKVETIGDAYMVVGGVPEASKLHAQSVADMSLGMILAAKQVMSPATGKPLQIRVGIHSGAVVAGVVGDKMPRYCLFGDTVNTASRMESHGVPGKIHCSSFAYEYLKDTGYTFQCRGPTEIKGKGKMVTYFLIRNDKIELDIETEENKELGTDIQAVKLQQEPKINGETKGRNTEGYTKSTQGDQVSAVCNIL